MAVVPVADDKQDQLTVIRPVSRWEVLNVRQIFEFRDLLTALGNRDIKLRYRQTALGVGWVIFQPLISALIVTFVFGRVAKLPAPDGLPYLAFAFANILGWTLFNSVFAKSSSSLVQNASLVSKVYFPKIIVPVSSVYAALVDFLVSMAVFLIIMAAFGIGFTWQFVLFPVWILLILLMALGLGLVSSALMVSYRDVQYLIPVFIQFLFFATPIGWALEAVPDGNLKLIASLNPLTGLFDALQWSLLGKESMHAGAVIYSVVTAIVVFVFGALYFGRAERRFADVI